MVDRSISEKYLRRYCARFPRVLGLESTIPLLNQLFCKKKNIAFLLVKGLSPLVVGVKSVVGCNRILFCGGLYKAGGWPRREKGFGSVNSKTDQVIHFTYGTVSLYSRLESKEIQLWNTIYLLTLRRSAWRLPLDDTTS